MSRRLFSFALLTVVFTLYGRSDLYSYTSANIIPSSFNTYGGFLRFFQIRGDSRVSFYYTPTSNKSCTINCYLQEQEHTEIQ